MSFLLEPCSLSHRTARQACLADRPLLLPGCLGAGTTRADGETVGFETEGTAIYDTMCFVKNEVGLRVPSWLQPYCLFWKMCSVKNEVRCWQPPA